MKQSAPFKNYFYPLPSCYSTGNYNLHDILTASSRYDPTANVREKWPYYIHVGIKRIYGYEPTIIYEKKKEISNLIPCIEGLFFSNPYYCVEDCFINLYVKKYDLPESFLDRDIMLRDIRTDYNWYDVGGTKVSEIYLIVNRDKLKLSHYDQKRV